MTLTQITKIRGAGIHTTSNIVSHNINSSGIITAVAFKGPFTGSSNIQSGILTATKIDLNGDIDVDGHTNLDNISVAGVSTFSGDATFSGNVSIGGTLTYEDVTNIDAVGVITARGDISIADKIVHTGDTNTQIRFPATDTFTIETAGLERVRVDSSGNFGINTNNPTAELDVERATGTVEVMLQSRDSSDCFVSFGDNGDSDIGQIRYAHSDNSMRFTTNTGERLRITSAGRVGIGTDNPSEVLHVLQSGTTAAEFRLENNEGYLLLRADSNVATYGAEQHIFHNRANDTEYLRIKSNGFVGIGTDNPTRFLHLQDDSNTLLALDSTDSNADLVQSDTGGSTRIRSVSGALEFFVGGNASSTNGTGSVKRLLIASNGEITQTAASGNTVITLKRSNTNTTGLVGGINFAALDGHSVASIQARGDGNDDGAHLQFYTTSAAAGDIFNAANIERLRIKSDGVVNIGDRADNTWIDSTLKVRKDQNAVTKIAVRNEDQGSSASAAIVVNSYGNSWMFDCGSAAKNSNALTIRLDATSNSNQGTEKLKIDTSGHILPGAAGTQNLGSTSKEWGDVFLATDKALKLGNSQIGDLFVDSSNVLYLRNSTGQMVIRAPGDIYISDYAGNHRAGFRDNSAVDLYFDIENHSTPKLSTTATGVSVHGEVAASQDYPTIRPTLDLNFAAVKKLDPRITYRRTGPASYTDEFGKVVLVGSNTPRFDHDPSTRECKGFLIEESRINILPYSTNVVGNSSWNRAGVLTENTTAVTAPDGSYDAIALRDNGANSQHTLYDDVAISDITDVYTSSCWIKAGSKSFAGIFCNGAGAGGTTTIGYKINLTTGAVTYVGAGGFESGTSATSTKYPNGWWRFTVTGDVSDSASGSGTFRWHVRPREDGSGNYQGDHSIGIYVWGLQLEKGTFPTSYIPGSSTGGTATRGKDLAEIDGEEFTDFFNQDEGTINCAYWLGNDSVGLRVFQINDSNNSVIDIVAGSGSGAGGYGYVNTGGVAQANGGQSSTNASRLNSLHVTTLAYKANDVAGINIKTGVLTNDTSVTLDGAYNRVTFYQGANGGDQLNGHLQRVQYYPKRLSDNQLKNLNNQ